MFNDLTDADSFKESLWRPRIHRTISHHALIQPAVSRIGINMEISNSAILMQDWIDAIDIIDIRMLKVMILDFKIAPVVEH